MDFQNTPFDLRARARDAMREEHFEPEFSAQAMGQITHLSEGETAPVVSEPEMDLRHLLWSSIDNAESRDLDQIEYIERTPEGRFRLYVGIADVDALVARNSPIDQHAAENTVSVYTGVATFPMLPERLSTDLTSLNAQEDRQALVVRMEIADDGSVVSSMTVRARVRNQARLTYEAVGDWLEGGPIPPDIAHIAGLADQLNLQDEVAGKVHAYRLRQGSLEFETVEAQPVLSGEQVVGLAVPHKNRARTIIENFMILANMTIAGFLEATGKPSLQRIVRSPERWPRMIDIAARYHDTLPPTPDSKALSSFLLRRKIADPEHFADLSLSIIKLMGPGEYAVVRSDADIQGHFGLAAYRYTHSTAPNRRFADLVTQRLIKASLNASEAPYSEADLMRIAAHCTERENAARKVERIMRKSVAAVLLQSSIGKVFQAIVTGASPKGIYVRLLSPPVEGRVTRGEAGLDVGDKVSVRLLHTDPYRGFIDFERA